MFAVLFLIAVFGKSLVDEIKNATSGGMEVLLVSFVMVAILRCCLNYSCDPLVFFVE